ncbi:protein yellow-like [Sitophilus oryzae]|uniref:Protein yellow-like n=1 Tax=Sitophilus oryzae TaxID=7048 RepID=A0A6J2XL83_SITOR|nr:protein yellow-like [Sitophilus oryzae]XP_030751651.1 protein yellow-like [Sitophilus oryzae]
MALDNWFSNWPPPFLEQPYQEPIKNLSTQYHGVKPPPIHHFLPLFMSLNVLHPPERKPQTNHKNFGQSVSFPPHVPFKKRKSRPDNQQKAQSHVSSTILGFNNPFDEDVWPKIPIETENFNENSNSWTNDVSVETEKPIIRNSSNYIPYEEEHKLKPLEVTGHFKTWYRWKVLDFAYPSAYARSRAISNKQYIPENNLPLGIEVYKNRIFISMPKWKPGVPVTLAQLPRVPKEESPLLVPYPNWEWHSERTCDVITSVFRMQADNCGRLWVLDSGKISITTEEAKQHCPPKLLIFDLETDELLDKYVFPDSFIKEDGLYSNIILDMRNDNCDDIYAYMSDVWRFGLVTFRLLDHHAWRVTDHLFFPDPLASYYKLHHLEFEWTDGLFGLALSPLDKYHDDRLLYFHPMSSYREFLVKTSYLRNETHHDKDVFQVLGQSRGPSSHISSSVMDDNGIMYHLLVTRDSIGCWDSRKPYRRENLGIIAKSSKTLVFPNDIRLDQEKKQSMWIITNRLPYYLIEGLNTEMINFRVLSAYADESIKGTICDPQVGTKYPYYQPSNDLDCY